MRALLLIALLASATVSAAAQTLSAGGMRGVPITVKPETLFHTLASDFFVQPDGTIYVQTGDIPAMWLRDASAQMIPYVRMARPRPVLRTWIRAVIAREMRNIEVDPYANAFRANYTVWERKWEVDSLAYPVVLTWMYENMVDDPKVFTPSLHRALERIVETYACEERHVTCSHYRFGTGSKGAKDMAPPNGLIWSAFRASDDPTHYAYNIPEQMFAVTALRDLADLASSGFNDVELAGRASLMAEGITAAIIRNGFIYDFGCSGRVYAYEVDGRGNAVFFDDANLPSLLGAPLSGYVSAHDPTYLRTRACILSTRNPYFYRGTYASGVGSPHTPHGYVWPLALMARALTSLDRAEVLGQLDALSRSAGSDGLIHESFDPNKPSKFTRAEFGWANAMYADVLFRAAANFPPEQVVATPPMSMDPIVLPAISVVDPATALGNRALLIEAFDRAVPFPARIPNDLSGSE